ncbi:hypothetical protein BDF21DRAFT_91819 [Thamnidium elegans]|nr:hypothetical protein BDF21DRAFT_91819 [Thamnidium elegans]
MIIKIKVADFFYDSERTPTASPVSSRSNSPGVSPRGSPSRSAEATSSPMPTMIPKHEKKTDFETILHVLSDLVLNDSRFKTANPKPSRPPFTMQTILIDIAVLLVQIRDDSNGLYHIGSVFLPAFEAFSDGAMLGKLLSMYLDNLLPKLMSCKDEPKTQAVAESKKSPRSEAKSPRSKSTKAQNTPTINIQSPEPESNISHLKMSHLTIDTRPFPTDTASPFSPPSPAGHSTHSSIQAQSIDNHRAFALFTPLLFFMIQYLDPYLAAQPSTSQQENLTFTLTRQANSIHNFHKALSYMMSCKPDLYLDILQVISHSTTEVKFRGCQVLLYYYFVSVGHVIVADPLPLLGTREELEILDRRRVQQEFEENRQNSHSQHSTSHHHQLLNPTTKQQNVNVSLDEDSVDDHHIWYPHIFDQKQSDTTINPSSSTNPNGAMFPLVIHDDMNEAFCKECFKHIQGYGLRCFQCKGSIHYNCSSSVVNMQDQGIMFYVKAGGIQKVVTPQFCPIPPQPRFRDMVNRGILGWNMKSNSTQVCLLGHTFHLVNLYTIIICACCGLPLWGISLQGYCCIECNRFVHPQCLAEAEEKNSFVKTKLFKSPTLQIFETCVPYQPLLESSLQISQNDLSKNLSEFYADALPLSEESLQDRSFEEVGTLLNTLLLQENILHYGVAAGCILITQDSNDPLFFSPIHHHYDGTTSPRDTSNATSISDDKISHCPVLTNAIDLCATYLNSGKCRGSTFLSDFYSNQLHSVDECILSKEEYLSHLSAMMKCLKTSFVNNNISATGSVIQSSATDKRRSAGDSRGFLQVSPNPFTAWDDEDDEFSEGHIPNEYLDRSTLLSWIVTNLNFRSRKAAEILLQHMCNLGLFERFDASAILFNYDLTQQEEKTIQCVFPVPYAIDCSSTVESLINSIDACLQDVDLSINECGFLLLVRRCWPDPFMSSYTIERLIYAIVSWTFDEDERLLALHAELTSGNKKSNIRHSKQQSKWAQAALISRIKGGYHADRNQQTAFNHNKTAGVSSGASSIYVITRAALRDRYIARWMEKVHGMDKDAYTKILFTAMENIIDNKREDCAVPNWGDSEDIKKHVLQNGLIEHIQNSANLVY